MKSKLEREFDDGFNHARQKHSKTPVDKLLKHTIPSSHGISARMFGWNAGLRVLRNIKLAKACYKTFLATAKRKLKQKQDKEAKFKKI